MGSINWSELQAAAAAEGYSNEVLPDGSYEVQVASVKVSQSQKGKPQIGVRMKVLSGVHAGKSFWDNLTLTLDNPKAMAVFFRKANDYGASKAAFDAGEGLEEIASHFVGTSGLATLGHREFNGKVSNQVSAFTPAKGGAAPQAFVPGSVASLPAQAAFVPPAGFPPPPVGVPHAGPSF